MTDTAEMPRPEWAEYADPTNGLIAFWVGPAAFFAALSPEQALSLSAEYHEHYGIPHHCYLDDVFPACLKALALVVVDKDGELQGTLRDFLAKKTEPGWIAGFPD